MRYTLFFLSLFLFLSGCGSNSKNNTFSQFEKEFILTLFQTEYLWYDQVVSNIDDTQYTTPQGMINNLRVTPPDRWSFMMTKDEYEAYVNQEDSGFGFGYTTNFQIYLVRIDSPVYGKLFRGDEILAINGEEATASRIHTASQNLNTQSTFTVLRNASIIDVDVTPSAYTFKSTLGKVIEQGSKKVGYLRYDSFTESSVEELEREFTRFKNGNVNELIIDLRYNGGGSISVASILLENISNAQPGKRQVYLDWNDNYKPYNSSYYFNDEVEANDLNMTRVFFLVTQNSASASELVISALKPYLGDTNVITIGTETHGKNVGMGGGRVYGENYYFLINFYVRNDAGEISSSYGIPATCSVEDDLFHLMGDESEAMLQAALDYISTGNCL